MSDPIPRADGQTTAERNLKALAEKTFLSLWSYPGPFRDQGSAASTRDGKEVCDLLVVFDPHILIFSDKDCRFPDVGDLDARWDRWFRRAILDSARQIWGAERWIRQFPDRLFLDRRCTKKFPFPLPPADRAIFHRIVVAHDGARACRETLGGSGSLMLAPEHAGVPFAISDLDRAQGFVHVFDDTSLGIVMSTLDTIADFVQYLERKERFIRAGRLAFATGEEELLAYYLRHVDADGKHDFVLPVGSDALALKDEGFWEDFTRSEGWQAEVLENRASHFWDQMIEMVSADVLAGTIEGHLSPTAAHHEQRLRLLASEPRSRRRALSRAFGSLFKDYKGYASAARVVTSGDPTQPFYVFLLLRQEPRDSLSEYRAIRLRLLDAYCKSVKLKFPQAQHIIGIATETGGSIGHSEDVMHLDARVWTQADEDVARRIQRDLGILEHVTLTTAHEPELRPVRRRLEPRELAVGRNAPCPCGSGSKFKKCCGRVRRR